MKLFFMKLIQKIVNPNKQLLILFSLIISPFIILERYNSLFIIYSYQDEYLIFIFSTLTILLLIIKIFDGIKKTILTYYIIIILTQFSLLSILLYPLKNISNKNSEKKGVIISNYIQKYKTEKGHFPKNLDDKYFRKIATTSSIGNKFYLKTFYQEKAKDTICYIMYNAMGGLRGSYNPISKKWTYMD